MESYLCRTMTIADTSEFLKTLTTSIGPGKVLEPVK